MALYDRLRVIVMESHRYERDSVAARSHFDPLFAPLEARYGGYCIERGGLRHFYIIDDPTDEQVAGVLRFHRHSPVVMIREYRGENPVVYDITSIVADIARVLKIEMFGTHHSSMELARCWRGVRVLEHLAR